MIICADMGLDQVEFEGDCQYIIQTVTTGDVGSAKLRLIVLISRNSYSNILGGEYTLFTEKQTHQLIA